jgi:hypothetical protein
MGFSLRPDDGADTQVPCKVLHAWFDSTLGSPNAASAIRRLCVAALFVAEVTGMRRTITLSSRQSEMVGAMFENPTDKHYSDEEIHELVARIWEWQWQVGRSVLDAINAQRGAQAAE